MSVFWFSDGFFRFFFVAAGNTKDAKHAKSQMKRCEESLKRNESPKWIFFLLAFSECLTVMASKARKNLSDAEKDMISRVHCFFEQELDFDWRLSIRNPRRRTHLATGVSETTVTRCVRRREQGSSNQIKKRKYNYHLYSPYFTQQDPKHAEKKRKKGRRRDGIRMPHTCTGNHGSKPRGYQDPFKNAPAMVWAQHCLSRSKNPKQTGQTLQNRNYM